MYDSFAFSTVIGMRSAHYSEKVDVITSFDIYSKGIWFNQKQASSVSCQIGAF